MRTRLSRAEWQVLLALWRLGAPAATMEVLAEVDDDQESPRNFRTIYTLLWRMIEKGWVEVARTEGRRQYYQPRVSKRRAMKEAAEIFVEETLDRDPEGLEILGRVLGKYRGG